ncbi:hypothetical protein HIM_04225 [Hirsutella minnesotensis 3608]|uniref:Uncharacterized protein n=1 Tax=Hirsutella minnesotensis 3608 TaxID=1043627 RepID=A0A0F7ZLK2_9HYPO|nr:hypothetical protein HIM_04225 [Hirsutella minnesotensis 3608]
MSGPPPPPPPHGHAPRSSGLPPGKYDIFVIPEHSAGSGFLYLPSMKPSPNSFAAGFFSALILVVLCQSMAPAFKVWWESFQGLGNMGIILLILGVGFGAWALGRAQNDGPPSGHGSGPHSPGQGHGGAGFRPSASSPPPPHPGSPPPPRHGANTAPPPHSPRSPPPEEASSPPPPPSDQEPRPSPQRPPPPDEPPSPSPPPQQEKPKPAPGESPKPEKAKEKPKEKSKGTWEKAREEMRKKEEERKAKEAEQKRRDEAARRLAELRAKEAKERLEREKEKERKEKERKEKRAKELAEEQKKKELEDLKKKLSDIQKQKELAEQREKERREREAREFEARKKKEAAEAAKASSTTSSTPKPAATPRVGSSYAYSAVGEKTNMWPNGRPSVPSQAGSTASRSPKSPEKRPPAPTARTYVSNDEDAYSFRPYDHPGKRSARRPSASSVGGSESSWAPSHTTARTSAPPSVRGPYSTKDPDKIVIQAVYLFMNQFAKTPASQLVSGVGSVTDGLILRITTEGLFIDDDVRGVPQREWDVKAWTLKHVEAWCPPHCLASTAGAAPNPAAGAKSAPHLLYKMATARRNADKDKMLTGDDADAYLTEMLRACTDCCQLGMCDRRFKNANVQSSSGQTGEWADKSLHILRATVRDQEGKRYLFVIDETEGWKVALGLQRLRRGTQVRQLGVCGMTPSDARGTLETVGWVG